MEQSRLYYFTYAVLAAILFGASTPIAKIFVGEVNPWMQAGLLYFGSGVGITFLMLLRKITSNVVVQKIEKKNIKWLFGATFFGGVLGPVFLMFGLSKTLGATASLLLNLEAVLTSVIAWTIFKEHFDRRIIIGMIVIVLGSLVLYWPKEALAIEFMGPFLVTLACLAWAIDNNFTRFVSGSDPLQITAIKSLVAGGINILLAHFNSIPFPPIKTILQISALGFFGYGLSLACFVLSLRRIGTSRTGAFFSTAPFVGAALSIFMLNESLTIQLTIGFILMGYGVWLHLTEDHGHEHMHEELEHEHLHHHDEHHQHQHTEGIKVMEPHSHFHIHEPITHKHKHFPDIHHRHKH